jgi:hypothetical protein
MNPSGKTDFFIVKKQRQIKKNKKLTYIRAYWKNKAVK